MKINVNHTGKQPRQFKSGDIVRHRKSGQLFILTIHNGGNSWSSLFFDVTYKRLWPSANPNAVFEKTDYELFEGTIELSNED